MTSATNATGALAPLDPTAAVIPKPLQLNSNAGAAPFAVTPRTWVIASGDALPAATYLAGLLRPSTGFAVPVKRSGPESGAIKVSVDPTADYPTNGQGGDAEAYRLAVSSTGVQITAKTAKGAFYGVQTLRQLMPAWVESSTPVSAPLQVAAVEIADAPRFAYRGVMLDVARSFQTVSEVKQYIDGLVLLKMNTLHMHLADDQGWRIQITNEGKEAGDPIDYSLLTSTSGKTAMSTQEYRGVIGRTGYYTQDEYRDIVAYAASRYVQVVPEVDVPSHTNAALHAIRELNTDRSLPARDPETGVVPWNGSGTVGYSALDEQLPLTYTFIKHVFSQLAEMSNSPYVHIGGDESHDMGRTRYVDFIRQVVPAVQQATGKGTMGWSEYADAGTGKPDNYWDGSVLQYWVGEGDLVRDFVAKGGKVVVSNAKGSYLDMKYNPQTPIGLTWACSGDCDVNTYYNWDPTTTVQGGLDESGMLGVEGALWSETVRGMDQAEFLTLPRAAAVLETGWTAKDAKDAADFRKRLANLGAHWTVAGHNMFDTPLVKWQATATGAVAAVKTGAKAGWPVGYLAAPGTELSADGSTVTPAAGSSSSLTGPVTGTLRCGRSSYPVRFTTAVPRDPVHASGLYTAVVDVAFTGTKECTLQLTGLAAGAAELAVPVRADAANPLPPAPFTPTGPATAALGAGGPVPAGEWTKLELSGFNANAYLRLSMNGAELYSVRSDPKGTFSGYVPLPKAAQNGAATFSATDGEHTASTEVTVTGGVDPLPNQIDQRTLAVADVDSQETAAEDGAAGNAIDGNPNTLWHTKYQNGTDQYPHHITLDLGKQYTVTGLSYLRRQIGSNNGVFRDYQVFVSADGQNWGDPVASGSFTADFAPQQVLFDGKPGRYVKLVGLNALAGNAFGGAAEINVAGTAR
ncbi:family 20 glycosylhydrolase [Nakamurella aerolata]|uniref:beta-N-acetylhexosaminidase n=1 Tax=Nakamurella aerolata TaxID=1656892 RepID=A0A849ABM0_9ACTN|nr:family 20 glycosylhydrolase [Nakamurella aerolata]NNG35880.1 family 20 glycosylhydrolase [Nakamurella aerolata]